MKRITQNFVFAIAVFAISLPLSKPLAAQEVGDRVCVTASFPTKVGKEEVGRVYGGGIHNVIDIKDKWCRLNNVKGWLPLQYVMNLDGAMEVFRDRLEVSEKDADAWAGKGMIHYENEQFDQAELDMTESIRHNPRNAAAWNNRAIIRHAQRHFGPALRDVERAIQLNPNYSHALYNRGLIFFAIGEYERAVESYDKALDLQPKNVWTYINRGSAKHSFGDVAGAESDYTAAIKMNNTIAESFVGMSNIYLSKNEMDESFKFASLAVKNHPKNAMALNARGWAYYKLDKIDDAIFDFDRAIRYAPHLSIVFNNRGICYAAKKDFKQAVKDYNRSIALNQGSAVSHTNRGTAHTGLEEFEKADKDFKRALTIAPRLTDAQNGLAWFRATCPDEKYRDGKVAKQAATEACKLSEWKDWTYIDTLAAAYAELGDFENAIKHQKKAADLAKEQKHKDECAAHLAMYQKKEAIRSTIGKSSDIHSDGTTR